MRAPRVVEVNRALAGELGLDRDELASPDGAQVLAGNALPAGGSRWRTPGAAPKVQAFGALGGLLLLGLLRPRCGRRA